MEPPLERRQWEGGGWRKGWRVPLETLVIVAGRFGAFGAKLCLRSARCKAQREPPDNNLGTSDA
jgi:hypothetical protein